MSRTQHNSWEPVLGRDPDWTGHQAMQVKCIDNWSSLMRIGVMVSCWRRFSRLLLSWCPPPEITDKRLFI